MVVGACRVELRLSACQSLKDKRSVVQPLLAELRRRFQLAAAEVEEQDRPRIAVLGFTCVSNDVRHVDSVLAHAANFVANCQYDAELVEYRTEVVHVL